MSSAAKSTTPATEAPTDALPEHINQNIADIVELQRQEDAATAPAQRRLERVSRLVAQPIYLVLLLAGVAAWICVDLLMLRVLGRTFDPPPFYWLQDLLTLTALLTTTVVLIAQRRQIKLTEERAHLDLQINLLTEQKVTKLIHLLEELRQDLPMVRNRVDPHVMALKEQTDAAQVLSALKDTVQGTKDDVPHSQSSRSA